ncbi:uncharacterized protein LOC134535023 isoform X3 [Bacillus rossius redtenbacheri]|uniref:uncharacterized protein LOC134535023 isoform X3 n=1 Tax=Bacillus rossius redtenbacheri TaxID=93214 RepID=UPI002FDDBB70
MDRRRRPPEPVPFDKPTVKPRVPELSLVLDGDNQRNISHHSSDGNGMDVQNRFPSNYVEDNAGEAAGTKARAITKVSGSSDIQSSNDLQSYKAWRMKHKLYLPSETERKNAIAGSNRDGRPECGVFGDNPQSKVLHTVGRSQVNVQDKFYCETSREFDSDDYEKYNSDAAKNYMHFLESSLRLKYDKEPQKTANGDMQNKNRNCGSTDQRNGMSSNCEEEQHVRKSPLGLSTDDRVFDATQNRELAAKEVNPLNDYPEIIGEEILEGDSSSLHTQMPQTVMHQAESDCRRPGENFPSHPQMVSSSTSPPQQNKFQRMTIQQQMCQERYETANTSLTHKPSSPHRQMPSPSAWKMDVGQTQTFQNLPSGEVPILDKVPSSRQPLASGSQSLPVNTYPYAASRHEQFNPQVHRDQSQPSQPWALAREYSGEHVLRTEEVCKRTEVYQQQPSSYVPATYQLHGAPRQAEFNPSVNRGVVDQPHNRYNGDNLLRTEEVGKQTEVYQQQPSSYVPAGHQLHSAPRQAEFNPRLHRRVVDESHPRVAHREYSGEHLLRTEEVGGRTDIYQQQPSSYVPSVPVGTPRQAEFNPSVHRGVVDQQHPTAARRVYGGERYAKTVGGDLPQTCVSAEVQFLGSQRSPARSLGPSNKSVGFSTGNSVGDPTNREPENKIQLPCTDYATFRATQFNSAAANSVGQPVGEYPARTFVPYCNETVHKSCRHTGDGISCCGEQRNGCCPRENSSLGGQCSTPQCHLPDASAGKTRAHRAKKGGSLHGCRDVQLLSAVQETEEGVARRCGHVQPAEDAARGCAVRGPRQACGRGCVDAGDPVDRAMLLSVMEMMKLQNRQIQALQDQLGVLIAPRHRDRGRKVTSKGTQTDPGQFAVSVGVGTEAGGELVPTADARARQAGLADQCHKHCELRDARGRSPSVDESLMLRGLDQVEVPEPAVSPVRPIHVSVPYSESSSDESASVQSGKIEAQYMQTQTQQENCMGWTFYNRVVGQVNKILEASPPADATRARPSIPGHAAGPECVPQAAAGHCCDPGVGGCDREWADQAALGKRVTFNPGFGPLADPVAVNNSNESELSLRMNALALKYLKDDQLTEFARLSAGGAKGPERLQDVTVYGMATQTTNLSFATMRYLERYHLIPPSENAVGANMVSGVNPYMESKPAASCQHSHIPAKAPNKILDISKLRKQTKLL